LITLIGLKSKGIRAAIGVGDELPMEVRGAPFTAKGPADFSQAWGKAQKSTCREELPVLDSSRLRAQDGRKKQMRTP
jgi:hypothetical protein